MKASSNLDHDTCTSCAIILACESRSSLVALSEPVLNDGERILASDSKGSSKSSDIIFCDAAIARPSSFLLTAKLVLREPLGKGS